MPRYPLIYEINTWVWLDSLSRKHDRPLTLATVPEEQWAYLASFGFDAVWFMGVRQRSPAGHRHRESERRAARRLQAGASRFPAGRQRRLSVLRSDYVVDEHLGGRGGLAVARRALASRGLR